jgi:DeoR/GlpR family transcriptional regulator of sugar metabolism
MIAAAERVIFALDNTKFGRKALSLTAPFDPRFLIVTDTRPAPEVINAIHLAGARLTLAERKPQAQSSKHH